MQNIIVEDRVYRTKMVKFIIMILDIHYYTLITITISVFYDYSKIKKFIPSIDIFLSRLNLLKNIKKSNRILHKLSNNYLLQYN